MAPFTWLQGALLAAVPQDRLAPADRQRLPPGFQRAEFLMDHGFLDKIVHRRELRATLGQLVRLLGPRAAAS